MRRTLRKIKELFLRRKLPGKVEGMLFLCLYAVRRCVHAVSRTGRDPSEAIMLVRRDIGDRYFYQVVCFFSRGGYRVRVVVPGGLRELIRKEYARTILALPGLSVERNISPDEYAALFVTDCPGEGVSPRRWDKKIILDDRISESKKDHPGALVMPYGMHPVIYKYGQDLRLEKYRTNRPRVRMFFAGMTTGDYSSNTLACRFGRLKRPEVLDELISSGLAVKARAPKELKNYFSGKRKNILVIADAAVTPVFQEKWLDTLSRCEFFLAPPGDVRLLCHNIIESMAVGTVPVTNYPEWFHPPLEHMKNCIVFDTRDDLVRVTREVLEMSTPEVGRLRRSVRKYYDEFLSPAGFVGRIDTLPKGTIEVFMNTGNRRELAKVGPGSVAIGTL